MYYFYPCNRKKKTLDDSVNKIFNYLDSVQLISKLQEIDKLKYLLLDTNQIKLFEYLPKQSVQIDINDTVVRKKSAFARNNIDFFPDDQKSMLQKASDAYEAYEKLKAKKFLSGIDKQLIKYLDLESIEQKFRENNFNFRQFIKTQTHIATLN